MFLAETGEDPSPSAAIPHHVDHHLLFTAHWLSIALRHGLSLFLPLNFTTVMVDDLMSRSCRMLIPSSTTLIGIGTFISCLTSSVVLH